MADVVKAKWYPSPPPALPGEPDEAYTARLTSIEHGPYDHARKRECAIGYHRSCSARGNASPANYRGACGCPCHTDDATMVGDESLREVVGILCDVYALPDRTGWHVVHFVDMLTGTPGTTVERVRGELGNTYGSEISEGFADDVVHMLANKGPTGGARAFWKRVHTEYRKGKAAAPLSLKDAVNRAIETATRPERPRRIESLGWEQLGPGPHPDDQPRIIEWLGKRLSRELDEKAASLLGIPVETDPSMPPGTWKMRMNDGTERTGTWPRITVPGVETLAEALKRVNVSPPEMTMPVERVVNGHWLLAQPWFVAGVGLIDHLHASCAPSMMASLSWRVPANLLPEPHPGAPYLMYHVPVRVDPGLPPGATPYLAFDLEEPHS
jgi:hypothetical protein